MILNEEIKALNNHAAFLSNVCDDHLGAIKYLQNALLLCNDLERSNPMVEMTSTSLHVDIRHYLKWEGCQMKASLYTQKLSPWNTSQQT